MHFNRRPKQPSRPAPTTSREKPTLEMVRLAVFRVHYRTFEEYVKQVLGLDDFDFLHAAGVSAGEYPEYQVNGELPTDEYRRRADELRRGRRTRDVNLVFAVLAADGYIPSGRYTIDTAPEEHPAIAYTHLLHRTRNPFSDDCLRFKARHARDRKISQRLETLDANWTTRNPPTASSPASP